MLIVVVIVIIYWYTLVRSNWIVSTITIALLHDL